MLRRHGPGLSGASEGLRPDRVQRLPVELDAVARAVRRDRAAVLEPERLGDVAVEPEAVRLEAGRVDAAVKYLTTLSTTAMDRGSRIHASSAAGSVSDDTYPGSVSRPHTSGWPRMRIPPLAASTMLFIASGVASIANNSRSGS